MDILKLIGRDKPLFVEDIKKRDMALNDEINKSSFFVIGGAGSIGQAVVKELFSREPKKLHVIDINENNLVELVRDLRSSYGYIKGDFKTFVVDCGSEEYNLLFKSEGPYDYILNLSAMKHVRSEKDPYSLMRMIKTNIINTIRTIDLAIDNGVKKYFCVSTDKAANPVNIMGASKKIMEKCLQLKNKKICISTARFANVAFSDGSLLYGFTQRLEKMQPITAPNDVKRYFVTAKEAGELCVLSAVFGENGDIFFPKLSEELHLITFSDIAVNFLKSKGLTPYLCKNEEEARSMIPEKTWPCYFSFSDTTGEKPFEEFFTENEVVDFETFEGVGIVKQQDEDSIQVNSFIKDISELLDRGYWTKVDILGSISKILPYFKHIEKNKSLESKM